MSAPTAASTLPAIAFRPATSQEIHEWVIPQWVSTYSHRLPAKMMRADTPRGFGRQRYWDAMEGKIRRLLATPGVSIRVADVDDIFAGWVCENRKERTLHYVHVIATFRRQGIGSALTAWINPSEEGLVILAAMPPQWFTNRGEDPTKEPWKPHQVIDILTSY